MAAKKAAKKVTKRVTKAVRKAVADPVFYVVLERGPFSAKAVSLHATREAALARSNYLESQSNAIYNKYSVQRVEKAD